MNINKNIIQTIISLGEDILKKLKVKNETKSFTINAENVAMRVLVSFIKKLPQIEKAKQKSKLPKKQ